MSENANNAPEEAQGSAVDFALGGEDSHSPEQTPETAPAAEPEKNVKTDNAPEEHAPDSAENKPVETPEPEPPKKSVEELEHENEALKKRLSDTQKKMHEATTERAELKKQYDELKAKQSNDEDWFGDDDKAERGVEAGE